MAKMKTPKKKEVVKYFENAKEVECLSDGDHVNIANDIRKPIHKWQDCFWIDINNYKSINVELWNPKQGYAKILSYKEPKEKTYKITREQILSLKNTLIKEDSDELLKTIFPEVFETKLTAGKWYWRYNKKELAVWNDSKITYGFRYDGLYLDRFSFTDTESVTEATEQEVTEALTKEAVRKGYNTDKPTHFNYKNGTGYLQNPSKSDFLFRDGILYLWDIKIFEDGQWAEIIPTLTIQEAEAKLKELGVNAKIV